MARDKVGIANLGLQMIGASRISSFSDNTREARAVSTIYDDARDEILCANDWTFARKRIQLTQAAVTIPSSIYAQWDGAIVAYNTPPDLLKALYINIYNALHKFEMIGGVKYILSDTLNLGMIYTYQNDDPTTYFPAFTQAFASLLAYRLCFNLSESTKKAADLFNVYNEIELPAACAQDSAQGTPVQPVMDEWEQARLSGGTPFIIQPGSQVWGYPW